jgi:hypothetical protein
MPDDLYERDFLAWSEQQAALLRRVAQGERVNGVDWPHVLEEIADLGVSELNAVRSLLRRAMLHLLKLHVWPGDQAARHWSVETGGFLSDAASLFPRPCASASTFRRSTTARRRYCVGRLRRCRAARPSPNTVRGRSTNSCRATRMPCSRL